jgi:hypothetical protein
MIEAPPIETPPAAVIPPAATPDPAPAPAATPTPAPAPAPTLLNPDGSLGENWHTALGDEFAPHAAQLGTYKDVKGLAKSLLHFRANGPAYPGEDSRPEDISRFHALAKVPAEGTPTAYGIQLPETASAEDRAIVDRLAATAHKHHLSGPGFAAVFNEFQAAQAEAMQVFEAQQQAQQKASEDALVNEWRGNYEANKSIVRHWTNKLSEQAGVDPADPSVEAMLQNPAFGRILLQVSKLSAEDGIRTPAGLGDMRSDQEKAQAIMSGKDPVWGEKYTKGSTEERAAAYKYVAGLLQSAAR